MILIVLVMLLLVAVGIKGCLDKNIKLCIGCAFVIVVNIMLGFYVSYLAKL